MRLLMKVTIIVSHLCTISTQTRESMLNHSVAIPKWA